MNIGFETEKAQPLVEPSDVASLLLEVLPLAAAALRKDLHRLSGGGEKCLTTQQLRILTSLWVEPMNNKTLAESLGVSVPASSRMVKMLAQRGFVEITRGIEDKREVRFLLTTEGRELITQARKRLGASLSERMWSVSPSESRKAETGLIALKKILVALHSQMDQ